MTKPSDWHLGMTFFAFDWRLWGDEIRSGGCRFRVESGLRFFARQNQNI